MVTAAFARTSLRSLCLCLLATAIAALPVYAVAQASGYDSVDPFIGTGADGHTFPGATVPFGMVQLSPDTQINNFKHSYKWAADTSLRKLYPDAPKQFKSLDQAQKYWCDRAKQSGFEIHCPQD